MAPRLLSRDGTPIKILHVEDNPENRMLVRAVLQAEGYTVLEAEDGLTGIELAIREAPALILLDINLPSVDGYEVVGILKSFPALSATVVVAVTAYAMEGDRQRTLVAGCDGYIQKPIDVDAFPRQVAEFLQGKRERVEDREVGVYLRELNQRLVYRLLTQVEELKRLNQHFFRRASQLEDLHRAVQDITSELHAGALLEKLLPIVARALGTSSLTVELSDPPGVRVSVINEREAVPVTVLAAIGHETTEEWADVEWRLDLAVRGRSLGVMVARQRLPPGAKADEEQLLKIVANQVAIAVENSRLYESVTRRAAEEESLVEAGRLLAGTLQLSEVLERLADLVRKQLNTDLVTIHLLDEPMRNVRVRAQAGLTRERAGHLEAGTGIPGSIMEKREPVLVPDLQADPRVQHREWVVAEGLVSLLGVPLLLEGRAVGALLTSCRRPRVFTPEEVALTEALATSAVVAIRNARLYEETQQRLSQTATLLAVSQAAGSTLDLVEIARRTTREMVRALGADMGGAWGLSPDRQRLVPLAGYHVPPELVELYSQAALSFEDPLVGEVQDLDEPVASSDSPADPRFDHPLARLLPHKSLLVCPMRIKDEVIGGFAVAWVRAPHHFTSEELRLVEGIARQGAVAIENARLLEAERQAREQLARDIAARQKLERRQAAFVEIVKELAAEDDFDRLFALIGQRACELAETDTAVVSLVEGEDIVLRSAYGEKPENLTGRRTLSESRVGRVVFDKKPYASFDMATDPHWRGSMVMSRLGLRASLDVPIILRGQVIGVLGALSRTPRVFSDDDVALLLSFAEHTAVALDRMNLLKALEMRLRETETLLTVSQAAGSTLDLTEVARRTTRELVRALGADMGGAWRVTPERDQIVPLAGYRVPKDLFQTLSTVQTPQGSRLVAAVKALGGPLYAGNSPRDPRFDHPLLTLIPHKSVLVVPMRVKGEIVGGFALAWTRQPHAFRAEELRLVEGMVQQAAVAIENARLLEAERETRERLEVSESRQETLVALSRELATEIDLDRLLPTVAEQARQLLAAHASILLLLEGDDLVFRGSAGLEPEIRRIGRLPLHGSLTGAVLTELRPLVCADLAEDAQWRNNPVVSRFGYKAMLAVPIMLKDRPLGVLKLLQREVRHFDQAEVEFLGALATQAALAIDNARLFQQTQTRLRETETLLEVSQALSGTLDPGETMRRVAREIAHALGADMVGAYLADPDQNLRPIAGYHVPKHLVEAFREYPIPIANHPAMEEAWTSRHAVWSSDSEHDPRIDRATLERFPHRSSLFVPMVPKGEPIGGFFVIWWTRERQFRPEEVRLVEGISHQAAIFLENTGLYSEATRRRREAEELARLARMLTESLDVADVGQRTAESALRLVGGVFANLRLLEPGGSLKVLARSGPAPEGFNPRPSLPAGEGMEGRAVAEGVPCWSADPLREPGVSYSEERRQQLFGAGSFSALVVPLRVKRQIIGTLTIIDTVGRKFTEGEVTLLQTFADQAAIALENSRLYGDLRAALRTVEESQQRIVQGERLRALGQMAGGVAHDFNNTLAIIVGRAEVLLSETQDAELRKQLDVIVKVALDASQTVRRIQEFTRMRRARPFQPVNLNQLIDEVVEVTRSRWKDQAQARGLRYEVLVEAQATPAAEGDPSEIREALTNIVFNALDAMPEGGRLTFRTGVAGDRVVCSVADTGVGMTDEVRQRVFDPFFTTKGERGTGLGLSVVYGIINRHGGELDVQSEVGRGSVFSIRLPVGGQAGAIPARAAAPRALRPGRILVIEDEKEVRDVLMDLLVLDRHSVMICPDGESGLARIREEAFDLVITDLGMPGVSGWEVARLVKQDHPTTPVAMVTGWGDRIDDAEAQARGVDYVVAKPFKRADIRAVVAAALERGLVNVGGSGAAPPDTPPR